MCNDKRGAKGRGRGGGVGGEVFPSEGLGGFFYYFLANKKHAHQCKFHKFKMIIIENTKQKIKAKKI